MLTPSTNAGWRGLWPWFHAKAVTLGPLREPPRAATDSLAQTGTVLARPRPIPCASVQHPDQLRGPRHGSPRGPRQLHPVVVRRLATRVLYPTSVWKGLLAILGTT